jgi:hypothetical protein
MIRSDPFDAQVVIARLAATISDDAVRERVDGPLEAAMESFRDAPESVRLQEAFLQTVGKFVQHLYYHGLPAPRGLSDSQARAEAVELLTHGSRNATDFGYEAALLDAVLSPSNGLDSVLAQLTENIKERERRRYVRFVLVRDLEPLGWSRKRAVAERLLSRMRPVLPPEIANRPPAQLIDEIPNLITKQVQTDSLLASMLAAAPAFAANPETHARSQPLS